MRILFNGAYTINSAGDDAALEAIIKLLQKKLGTNFESIVLSRHPNKAFDDAFGVTTIQNLEYKSKNESLNKWLRGFNINDNESILFEYLEHFENADLVILGAGNFLNDNSFGLFKGMLSRFCISAFLAQLTNTPCLLYGLSSSTLRAPLSKYMAHWLLNNSSKVTFRDKYSYQLIKDLDIKMPLDTEILPDPVMCSSCTTSDRVNEILNRENIPIHKKNPRLAVSVRSLNHLGEEINKIYLNNLKLVIDHWTTNSGEVLFIPQCTYELDYPYSDDRNVAMDLIKNLRHPELVYNITSHYWPWEIEGLYTTCDISLCTRLHAGVFSCKHSIPTVALAYEPKVNGFWDSIDLTKYCIPLDTHIKEILNLIHESIDHYPTDLLAEKTETIKKRAERYADLAIELLN